jgi:4'-phosphopantetheinyl transferase
MQSTFDWLSPPSHPELSRQGVHVWRASLECDSVRLKMLAQTLGDDERSRAQRFLFDRDRNSFIAARGILRDLLARYSGCTPGDIEFVYGPNGKPALSPRTTATLVSFNLSHSHGVAVIAVTKKNEIGIDVERIQPERAGEEIAKRYFAPEEVEELLLLPADQRAEGFFLCWTRKEAYLKALGEGLRFPLDRFRVSLSPSKPAQLYGDADAHWSIEAFDPSFNSEARYVAAVVAKGKDLCVEYYQWR